MSPAEKKSLAASLTVANAVETPVYASLQKMLIKREKNISQLMFSLPPSLLLFKFVDLRLPKGEGSTQNEDTLKEES